MRLDAARSPTTRLTRDMSLVSAIYCEDVLSSVMIRSTDCASERQRFRILVKKIRSDSIAAL